MKVKGATSKEVVNYLFDVGAGKFLSGKEKKYLHELCERWDPGHLQLDEDFDDYLDNDWQGDIVRDEPCKISTWMTILISTKGSESCCTILVLFFPSAKFVK